MPEREGDGIGMDAEKGDQLVAVEAELGVGTEPGPHRPRDRHLVGRRSEVVGRHPDLVRLAAPRVPVHRNDRRARKAGGNQEPLPPTALDDGLKPMLAVDQVAVHIEGNPLVAHMKGVQLHRVRQGRHPGRSQVAVPIEIPGQESRCQLHGDPHPANVDGRPGWGAGGDPTVGHELGDHCRVHR
jgi:hypothetical protein